AQPSREDLAHRAVVVVAGDARHLEAAIVAALGEAVLHHHHRADVVAPLQVAHVVALDPKRRGGGAQGVLPLVGGAPPPGAGRRRWGASCSLAFWRATSRRPRFRPRWGTAISTRAPRRSLSQAR